jgi:hypothetical protein
MSSANTPPTPPVLKPLQAERQGIKGRVLRLSGNHMPRIREPGIREPGRSQQQAIQTEVWVFTGRVLGHGTHWAISEARRTPNLLGKVATNAQGEFSVALAPGEYTLLAQYGSNLYLNAFQGDGSYASWRVQPGKTTVVDLVNSENATF